MVGLGGVCVLCVVSMESWLFVHPFPSSYLFPLSHNITFPSLHLPPLPPTYLLHLIINPPLTSYLPIFISLLSPPMLLSLLLLHQVQEMRRFLEPLLVKVMDALTPETRSDWSTCMNWISVSCGYCCVLYYFPYFSFATYRGK